MKKAYFSFLGTFNVSIISEEIFNELSSFVNFSYINMCNGKITYGNINHVYLIKDECDYDENLIRYFIGELISDDVYAPIDSVINQ